MAKVAKVPVVMQMEALECGAACPAMILAYYDYLGLICRHKVWYIYFDTYGNIDIGEI